MATFILLLVFQFLLQSVNGFYPFWQKEVYHDAVHPNCNVLNYEKIEEPLPTFIEINGKSYQVLGQIQHGATSKVLHVMEQGSADADKICVAVKVVDMSRIERRMQNQVTNEAHILSELNAKKVDRIPLLYAIENHPSKQTMSMVLELAHHDLFDEITPNMGRGKHSWVRQTFGDILRALEPVHGNGIVHADIKPENIAYFLKPDGQLVLKVIDFGGAIREQQLKTACSEIVTGTVMYMSPEQVAWCAAHGEERFIERQKDFSLSKKSDVWSVGIILYQMLFGRNPYSWVMQQYEGLSEPERTEKADRELRQIIFDQNRPIEFNECPDEGMLEMLKKCLNPDPQQRPDVPELLAQLKELGDLNEKLKALENEVEEMEKNGVEKPTVPEAEQMDNEERMVGMEEKGEEQEVPSVNAQYQQDRELALPANFIFHVKNIGNMK